MFKIAVFRALQLGDLLCAIPAISALKYNYPQARLYFIGLPHMRELIDRFDCIDEFIDFPGHPDLPEIPCNLSELAHFISRMQAEKFDLLLQIHGQGTIVNTFLQNFNARRLVGFQRTSDVNDPDWLKYPDELHEVDRHLALVRYLGLQIPNTKMYFPLFANDWTAYNKIKQVIAQPFIIVHVGSRDIKRQWPIENFALLAKKMLARGYKVVMTGVKSEQALVDKLQECLEDKAIDLCGQLDLGTLGCLLKETSLLICNCTGISHLAAALHTKSIVLSMDGEPHRWGPQDKVLHATFDARYPIAIDDITKEINRLVGLDLAAAQHLQATRKISEE